MDVLAQIQMPPVTAGLMGGIALLILLVSFDVVHPLQLIFSPTLVFEQRQYWRLLTTFFFFGKLNMRTLLELNWIYNVSSAIEEQYFHRRSLDYGFVLAAIFGIIALLRSIQVIDMPYLSFVLVDALVYIFSRLLPEFRVHLMPLLDIPMKWLPLLCLVRSAVLSEVQTIRVDLIGNLVGHFIWYLLEVFPRISGIHLFRVRSFVDRLLVRDRIIDAQHI